MLAEPIIAIDRVVRMAPDGVEVVKYLSGNELVFVGHYPHFPIFPGVLLLEIMLQAIDLWSNEHSSPLVFSGVRGLRLFSPATPGDVITCAVRVQETVDRAILFKATCACDDRQICKATISYATSTLRTAELAEAAL